MKKLVFICTVVLAISVYAFVSCKRDTTPPKKAIANTLLAQIDSFSVAKNKLLTAIKNNTSEKGVQGLFLQTRIAYKKFEWAAEYFVPATSRFVNGPPVQEIEVGSGQVFEPAGLQVVEAMLFPKYNTAQKKGLITQLGLLQTGCDRYKSHFANIEMFDSQVIDAVKLEVFRIIALGISGFDNPLTLKSSEESAACLESLKAVLAYYDNPSDDKTLPGQFDAAVKYLQHNTNFNQFDRAAFIISYGNPLTTSITRLEKTLKLHVIRYNRLLNQDAKTMFDKDAFNANAFAPGDSSTYLTQKKVALGLLLFADPSLSGTKTRSCKSCHQPEKAFTDGLVANTVINGKRLLKRNTPTLINAALQPSQFDDLRVGTLEDQSLAVVQNKEEMHGSMKQAAKQLWGQKGYRELFSAAFPKPNRTGIDTLEVMNAIGSYIRSLVFLNSRFDDYMRGNKTAMDREEINGFNLFMGKARCATCHYMPLFNGSFPPRYTLIESEVIGVPQTIAQKAIDTDMGRYNVLKTPAFKHAFKITTVRNAARTAPYMHNGVFTTLQQVMDFYNKGGGVGLGFKLGNQTLPAGKLNLTEKESNEVIAFIKSLDSK